jgi:hypothetical protein
MSKINCNIPMPKVAVVGAPGIVAKIKLCGGAVTINVDNTIAWKKPTDEQIKNLHDMLCIDVEVLGE